MEQRIAVSNMHKMILTPHDTSMFYSLRVYRKSLKLTGHSHAVDVRNFRDVDKLMAELAALRISGDPAQLCKHTWEPNGSKDSGYWAKTYISIEEFIDGYRNNRL